MIALQVDTRQLAKLQKALANIKNGVPRALAPAINRALDKGRTTVKREIRKEYLIKAGDIPIAVQGASQGNLNGQIVVASGMLPLDRFQVRPRGVARRPVGGLYAQVKKGSGGNISDAFNIPGKVAFRRRGSSRLPIKRLYTIGAAIMASQPNVGPEVNKQMALTLARRIDHELKRVLASAGK